MIEFSLPLPLIFLSSIYSSNFLLIWSSSFSPSFSHSSLIRSSSCFLISFLSISIQCNLTNHSAHLPYTQPYIFSTASEPPQCMHLSIKHSSATCGHPLLLHGHIILSSSQTTSIKGMHCPLPVKTQHIK